MDGDLSKKWPLPLYAHGIYVYLSTDNDDLGINFFIDYLSDAGKERACNSRVLMKRSTAIALAKVILGVTGKPEAGEDGSRI